MMYINEWHSFYAPWYGAWGGPFLTLSILIIITALAWSAVWKALGLWHAARDGNKGWFVALFLINTLGILEILYIYVFRKKKGEHQHHNHPTH